MRLSQFDIHFKLRPTTKAQALVNFIVECMVRETTKQSLIKEETLWTLSLYSSSNEKVCRGGVILVTLEDFIVYYALRFNFKLSNSEDEYEALLYRLQLVVKIMAEKIRLKCDLKLMVN